MKEFTKILDDYNINRLRIKLTTIKGKIKNVVDEISIAFLIFPNEVNNIKSAISIAEKYHYSFYDSLIIASALETNCKTLYSEDMQHSNKHRQFYSYPNCLPKRTAGK